MSSGDGGGVPVEAPEAELVGQGRELRHLRGRQREVEQRQVLRQVRLARRLQTNTKYCTITVCTLPLCNDEYRK